MDEMMEETPTVFRMTLVGLDGAVIGETPTTDTPEELEYAGSLFTRVEVSESHVVYKEVARPSTPEEPASA